MPKIDQVPPSLNLCNNNKTLFFFISAGDNSHDEKYTVGRVQECFGAGPLRKRIVIKGLTEDMMFEKIPKA